MVKGKIRMEESTNDPLATMSAMSLKLMMLYVPNVECHMLMILASVWVGMIIAVYKYKSKNKKPDN